VCKFSACHSTRKKIHCDARANEAFEIAKNEFVLIPLVAYFIFVTISKIHFKLATLRYSNNSTNSNYIYVCSIGLFGARIAQSEQLLVYVLNKPRNRDSIPRRARDFLFSDSEVHQVFYPVGANVSFRETAKLPIFLRSVARLRTQGAIPPSSHMSAWHGA
jgi:hypothetical protein